MMSDDFDPLTAYIHVFKEYDTNGNEGAVLVQLSYDDLTADAFRVVSKNSEPDPIQMDEGDGNPQSIYYNAWDWQASKYAGSGSLRIDFAEQIKTQGGQVINFQPVTETILQQGGSFTLLVPANPVTAVALPTTDPYLDQAGALSAPFFYEDIGSDTTFFVQPFLTETSFEQWPWWAISVSAPDPNLVNDNWWNTVPIVSQVPTIGPVSIAGSYSIYQLQPRIDWITHPSTVLFFGTGLVGSTGGIHVLNPGGIGRIRVGQLAGSLGNARTAGNLNFVGGIGLTKIGGSGLTVATLRSLGTSIRSGPSNLTFKPLFGQLQGSRL
jgi:hypothetical protein